MNVVKQTPPEQTIGQRYFWQFLACMVLYVVVLYASIHVLKTGHFSPLFRDLIAITPAVPVFGVVASVIQFVLSIDELQRQIHLEALAIAAGVTAALAITYTFLEGVGFPHAQTWWAFECICIVWAVSLPFIRRRYQ